VAKKKTEMTEEEKAKKEITDKQDALEEMTIDNFKKQLEQEGFLKRLKPYAKPVINQVIGTIVSVL